MSERERKRDEIKKKGIPIAEIGADVIWDDPKLKVPFTSYPFISRMKGSAILNMAISFGLYYNELAKKWMPITSATMTESLIKARYYPEAPDGLTELSDNPLIMSNDYKLLVSDSGVRANTLAIKVQTDKLQFDGSNNLKCIYAL